MRTGPTQSLQTYARSRPHGVTPQTRRRMAAAALSTALVMFAAPAFAQTYFRKKVDPDPGLGFAALFSFPPPAAACVGACEDRVMLAKFVVDESTDPLVFAAAGPLTFQVFWQRGATTLSTNFATTDAVVPVADPDSNPMAGVRAELTPSTPGNPGILKISVIFDDTYGSATDQWSLLVRGDATKPRRLWGFKLDNGLASTANGLVTQPKLIKYLPDSQIKDGVYQDFPLTQNLAFGNVHVNLPNEYVPSEYQEFRNVGPAPLTITAAPVVPAGAFTVPPLAMVPLSIAPMGTFQRLITCRPTALGAIPVVSVQMTTTAGPVQLDLSGRGVRANSAILFDLSESMVQDKSGTWNVPEDQQKVYFARTAALRLTEKYNMILPTAQLGLYIYPNLVGDFASSQTLIPLGEIGFSNNIDGYRKRFNNVSADPLLIKPPSGSGTPMAEGIKTVWNVLSPIKSTDNRTAVFQIGDGEHNQNSAPPKATPADWYNAPEFQNAIPFFTVPYGPVGSGWLQTFQQVAAKSGGEIFPADVTDPPALDTQFTKALGKALDMENLKDPKANIAAGGRATHPVCVTTSTYQLVFSVHWTEKDANAVAVTVETPDHTILTPTSPAAHPGHVSYSPGLTFADYVVRGKFLRGDAGVGVWKLHIQGNRATPYAYSIQAVDGMKSQATLDLSYIGKGATLIIKYLGEPHAVAGVSLTARYERPAASFNTYLARTPITPELIARVPREREMTLAERKAYALTHYAEKPFRAKRVVETYRFGELELPSPEVEIVPVAEPAVVPIAPPSLRDLLVTVVPTGPKTYQLPLRPAEVDGLHKVVVTAKGVTARDECFERDYEISRIVDMLLTPAIMRAGLRWEEARPKPFFDPDLVKRLSQSPPPGTSRMSVTFTPVDKAGHYWGIGRADAVRFALKGARPLGRVMDNLDGSYTQVVEFKTETRPTASVVVGKTQSGPIPLQPIRPIPGRPTPGRPTPVAPTPAPGTPR